MLFDITEDDVFRLIPSVIKRPSEILANDRLAKQGIDSSTFEMYITQYESYVLSEIYKAGLSTPSMPPHILLKAALCYLVAGAIMRMFDNVQNPYKDLFATGNIMLRSYIDQQRMLLGSSVSNAPELYTDDTITSELFSFLN
jgi:hypothetical protein